VTLQRIVLPQRLTKTSAETEEEADESRKLENVTRDFAINLERARKQANEILNKNA
jgi:hypothetical protein